MATGLAVSDVVNVTINMAPTAIPVRNFGALLIAGSSDVIDVTERVRVYSTIDGVVEDFGTSAPEYLAASLFFSQSPRPSILYIGRWAEVATAGILHGAVFSAAQQAALLTTLQAVTSGGFTVLVDGTSRALTGLNFSSITNLNGAATVIGTALTQANVTWDGVRGRFDIQSKTTGASSSVTYATAPGSGTALQATLGLTAAAGASAPVAGIVAESPVACAAILLGGGLMSADAYGFMFADTSLTNDQHIAVSAYIEAAATSRIYGITTQASAVLDSSSTTDLAYLLKAAGYERTFIQYSSSSPYAVASLYGRAFTVDFTGNNTTITLKFKQQPGITAETLTESQAAALTDKHCNVFVAYNNASAIIQQGVMCNGYFFDEVHGTDWLQNSVQTAIFNLLYQSPTKVPQTDPGTHLIVTTIEHELEQAVTNGLVAPGQWNAAGFGQLAQGDYLGKGFYVYAPPISAQSQSDREARKSVPIQCAIKLAGAVHSANVAINVNR